MFLLNNCLACNFTVSALYEFVENFFLLNIRESRINCISIYDYF